MESSLQECEQNAERLRAKLEGDLARLRSPATYESFKEDLKDEALATKDVLVEQAKTKVETTISDFIEDLKAKAIANPAATLAIGTGLAVKLVKNPPIATALIGVGLMSLLRTRANGAPPDVKTALNQASAKLKEQIAELSSAAGEKIAANAESLLNAATEKMEGVSASVSDATSLATSQLNRAMHNLRDTTSDVATVLYEKTTQTVEDSSLKLRSIDDATKDAILLGIAGIAASAAVGIALQRRLENKELVAR